MPTQQISRRTFLGDAAATGFAFTIVPRHVLGGPGYRAPSDTLNVACIGVGGRGAASVRGVSGENVYALCDVDENSAGAMLGRFSGAKRYKDFRVMLETERDNIDAVTVATPDHTHAVASMMAMQMGKGVYCEKPLARSIWEVRQLSAAAQRYGVAT